MAVMDFRKNNFKWIVVKSKEAEFIVPDHPFSYILPVSPKVCLIHNFKTRDIKETEVSKINSRSISESKKYHFARNFSDCPTIPQI